MHARSLWQPAVISFLIVSSFLVRAQGREGSPARQAREILDAAGVQGGLVVHVGCGDGRLTAALRANESYLVMGLDRDRANVDQARKYIQSRGGYGPVSADVLQGDGLPFIDGFVNLIVMESPDLVPTSEIQRVLAPKGVACMRRGNECSKTVKAWPQEIDEWTHYLHDPTNNAVAQDKVIGPPRHFQWVGGPRYSRHHDHMSGASAMVTAGGRLFYIFDHASPMAIQLPSQYRLVARDAFNGTVLWTRAIDTWYTQMFRRKSGPAQLTRRLVAVGDRVYVTLDLEAPVTALDAATGRTVRTYAGTDKTEEILFSEGTLFLLVNDAPFRQPRDPHALNYNFVESPRRVVAVETASGKILWDRPQPNVLPLTLTADSHRVLLANGEKVVCLDRADGRELWQSQPLERRKIIPTFFAPSLVLWRDVVLYSAGSALPDAQNAGGGTNSMYALSAQTGETLWTAEHPPSGYKSPEDILVVDDLVWTTATTFGTESGVMIGRDPHTGQVRKQFLPDVQTHWFHHRCYRAKATEDYILTSRTGIEFVDPQTEHWVCNHWVRGACLYGVMPANGMVYNPPHPCACYLEAKLYGFNALAPSSPSRQVPTDVKQEDRLEKGPAYGQAIDGSERASDWPTYRGDPARSGHTNTPVPANLQRAWQASVGDRLSGVIVASGKVFVASIDQHLVHALDAESGKAVWSYTAGGRVDSTVTASDRKSRSPHWMFPSNGARGRICSARRAFWMTCGGIAPTGSMGASGSPAPAAITWPGKWRRRVDRWFSMRRRSMATVASPSITAGRLPWSTSCSPRPSDRSW